MSFSCVDYAHAELSSSQKQTLYVWNDRSHGKYVHPAASDIAIGIQEVPLHVDNDQGRLFDHWRAIRRRSGTKPQRLREIHSLARHRPPLSRSPRQEYGSRDVDGNSARVHDTSLPVDP